MFWVVGEGMHIPVDEGFQARKQMVGMMVVTYTMTPFQATVWTSVSKWIRSCRMNTTTTEDRLCQRIRFDR